jgi:PAS domain S-box-containing protein
MSKSISDLEDEVVELQRQLQQLENLRCQQPEDILTLLILENAPFTVWACNRNFEIVLWNKQCEIRYSCLRADAIGKNFFDCFAHDHEREQAKKDCRDIIDNGTTFENFIAVDHDSNGKEIGMLTNCFRVRDHRTDEYVQAEIGIDISGFELSKERHRSIRDFAKRMEELRLLNELQDLKLKLRDARIEKNAIWQSRNDETSAEVRQLQEHAGEADKRMLEGKLAELTKIRIDLDARFNSLDERLHRARWSEELEGLRKEVVSFSEEKLPAWFYR